MVLGGLQAPALVGKNPLAVGCEYSCQLLLSASAVCVRALQPLHKWSDVWFDIHGPAVPHRG